MERRSAFSGSRIRLATGPELHVVERGPRDGMPVVLLHGWPDSWFTYSRVMPLMADDLRAIAVDQRGFGDSDRPNSTYSFAELAGDVVALLDALGAARATVVGHSFGSFVARQVAIAFPARVSALALIGTGFTGSNATTRELQTSMRDLPDPIPLAFARDFQASTAYRPLPPEFFDRIVTESMKLPPRLWKLAMDRLVEYDDVARLSGITAPTALIWGDRDALFSHDEQRAFMTMLPSARLHVYEDTGHCPNWEQPERLARDIDALVRRARS